VGAAFIGSESVASGGLTPYELRTKFVTIHRDVYIARGTEITALVRAEAAWLWSQRRGVIAGYSAAALHGTKWIDAKRPAEIIHDNRHAPVAVRSWSDCIDVDEISQLARMSVTTPARTALDIASRCRIGEAVVAIDALSRATDLKSADVELLAERYKGRRGIRRARRVLRLVDAGAESPRETWLRLLLIRAGFPAPRTQIPVYDEYGQLVAVLDMGWADIKLAVEYDGEHHWTSRRQFSRDIRRAEALADLGWIVVRITAEDTEGGVVARVSSAWERRV
jgi:very-short-patch-repair endonuclease